MDPKKAVCPDCENGTQEVSRRDFLKTAALASAGVPVWATANAGAAPSASSAAETAVKALFEILTDDQKKAICFDWDYIDTSKYKRGLLRTHVSNNWQITPHHIRSDYFTKQQQMIIHDIFKGIINPEWYPKILKQLKDDTRGQEWGAEQAIAIFGKPGSDKFEFVMTGRHMTIRADGNTESHVAFGGPIFYGHAASGFNEKVHHPGNVFWHQAELANKVFQMMDDKQKQKALVEKLPHESEVPFRGDKGPFPGIAVSELADESKKELQKVLMALIEPYRKEDQEEALACVKKQGGLDKCHLTFYKEGDLGDDKEWDNWRLEGPSFVWYYRGFPHVHVWVNVASDPSPKLNSKG